MVFLQLREKVVKQIRYGLNNAPKTGVKLFVRREDFKVVGLVTAKKTKIDPSRGVSRWWVAGVKIGDDWEIFEEPLDRWNPATNQFESCILHENEFLILTARRKENGGDEEENFIWLENPLEVSELKAIMMESQEKNKIINTLREEVETEKRQTEFWRTFAESNASENRNLREQISRLSREVALLRATVEQYKREAFVAEGLHTEIEVAVRKLLSDATERGMDKVRSDVERILSAAENLRKVREELGAISITETSPEELRKLKSQLIDISKKLDAAAAPPPKPLPKKEEG